MKASELPAKRGAYGRGDDDVVCRVEDGRAAATRRRRWNRGKPNQGTGNLDLLYLICNWLASIDEGCTHQGSWGWVG